jgi:phospholipid/cholesterol/gamma-HCH transport system substrate-binding protein
MPEEQKKTSYVSTIITAVLIAGGIWWFANRDKFSSEHHYVTSFQNVEGLTVSSQVSLNGAIIGKVSEAVIEDSAIKVTLVIDPEVKIKKGATARLISAGMSGGKEIKLTQGDGKTFLEEGGTIIGVDTRSMLGANGQLGATLKTAKIALRTTDSIITDLSTLLGTAAIKDIRFQLNKLDREAGKAEGTSREYRGTGEDFAEKIHEVNSDVAQLAEDSKEWSADIRDIEQTSGDLVRSTAELEKNMTSISASLKKLQPIFNKANDKKSTLGKALEDKQDYHTANRQMQEVDRSAKDVMARPSAYWFAIFGNNR